MEARENGGHGESIWYLLDDFDRFINVDSAEFSANIHLDEALCLRVGQRLTMGVYIHLGGGRWRVASAVRFSLLTTVVTLNKTV